MIVVSGANGFLGAHFILECFKRNNPVKGLIRKGADLSYFKSLVAHYKIPEEALNLLEWVEVDYEDPLDLRAQLSEGSIFVHCAGLISFDNKFRNELIAVNRDLTEQLVDACIEKNYQRFIYLSSIATCSFVENLDGKLEDRFESAYGLSKFLGELEVLRGEEEGLEGIIVRPGVVLGPPPENNDFHKLASWLASGKNYSTAGGTGFVEIRDLARYVADLCEAKNNVGATAVSHNLEFKTLNQAIAEGFGINSDPTIVPKGLLRSLSALAKVVYLFSNKEQPLPTAAVNALCSQDQYENEDFAKAYNSFNDANALVRNMVDYLKSSKKL